MKPRIAGALIAAAAMSVPIDTAAQRVDTTQVLQRVAAYVRDYELSFASVVCEELYTQRARNVGAVAWETRELRSEIALVRTRRGDWRLFRDVFAVDGKTVRDRDERLLDLFARSDQSEALRISEESARYNIGPISRTLNVPTLALIYLTADEQSRSRFKVAGRKTTDGRGVLDLRFEERDTPRLVYTRDRAPASGRAGVDAEDGIVRGTELRILTEGTLAIVSVLYAKDEKLALWIPQHMTETYRLYGRKGDTGFDSFDRAPSEKGLITEGNASYTNCRKFSVDARIK